MKVFMIKARNMYKEAYAVAQEGPPSLSRGPHPYWHSEDPYFGQSPFAARRKSGSSQYQTLTHIPPPLQSRTTSACNAHKRQVPKPRQAPTVTHPHIRSHELTNPRNHHLCASRTFPSFIVECWEWLAQFPPLIVTLSAHRFRAARGVFIHTCTTSVHFLLLAACFTSTHTQSRVA